MTNKDIEKMLNECDGLDMSHIKKDDVLAKAKREMYFSTSQVKVEEEKKEKGFFTALFTNKRFVPTLAGVALALMICFCSIGLYNENFQTVYIDINPSVALKLNRFERVIGVEFLNDDAKALLSDTKLVGCDAKEALQTVINACDSAGYVKENSEIYISASAKEEKSSEKLLQKLKGHAENLREEDSETYAVSTYNAKKSEKKNFEKESLSPAKYNVIREIIDEDGGYRIEDLKDKPMDELRKIKNRLDDDDFDDDDFDDDDDRDDFDDDRDDGDRDDAHGNKPSDKSPYKPEDEPEDDHKNSHNSNDKDDEDEDDDDDEDERDDKENKKPREPK